MRKLNFARLIAQALARQMVPATNTDAFLQQMDALRQRFNDGLPDKLSQVRRGWEAFANNHQDEAAVRETLQVVHRLAGSGATFGHPQVSRFAKILEGLLEALLGQASAVTDRQAAQARELLECLERAAAVPPLPARSFSLTGAGDEHAVNRDIFIAESDPASARELKEQLDNFGYSARVFSDAATLDQALQETVPAAVLIDLELGGEAFGGVYAAIRVNARAEQHVQWIFLSRRDDLEARLKAIHAGSRAFFLKPLRIADLLKQVETLTETEQSEPYRVLIVEDDAAMAHFAAMTLEQARIKTACLDSPATFLDVVSDFKPELVLMDLYLGSTLGTDLAQVLEQHDGYDNLPVIYLSGEDDKGIHFDALDKGGDNFLQKPINPQHLVQAVHSRVRRARQLAELVHRDGLTGIMNHRAIMGRVTELVKRCIRHKHALSLAMLDIDFFKPVNDTHGHAVGDRVLQALGRMMQQRLRESDLVGRYGGEEFLVLLPETGIENARQVIDEVRDRFAKVKHTAQDGSEFMVTFSAGLACLPPHSSQEELLLAADEALYAAKHAGRNQVSCDPASDAAAQQGIVSGEGSLLGGSDG